MKVLLPSLRLHAWDIAYETAKDIIKGERDDETDKEIELIDPLGGESDI
jgi:hypothetical protein